MDIVDAHHHLWDLEANYYPWLTNHITPRICGDYAAIRKDYLLADYLGDIGEYKVVKSVHVQAEHDPRDPVRETAWLQAIADDASANSRGFPNAIVAYTDLSAPNAATVLEGHCRHRNTRGIRQSLNGIINDPSHHRDLLKDDNWRGNIALLAALDLSYDLQLFPVQMREAAAVVRQYESVQFLICHTGLPVDRTPEGMSLWRRGMRLLADMPNTAVKISGLGMFDRKWTTESIRPLVLEAIDIFGPQRAMFASNFPVDGMMATYGRVWSSFEEITRGFPEGERRALFHDNAVASYRL
jgi:predicted TIM-barrel fold metal-dependent hydrolase